MLRNHFGWASRTALALALLGVLPALTAFGGPLIGLPPLTPVTPSNPTGTYSAPTTINISGYVYIDSAGVHTKQPGEWGISGATITLQEVGGFTVQATTNAAGYYTFLGVPTGAQYTLTETQPSGFTPSASNPGYFMSSSGLKLTDPGNPSTGTPAAGTTVSTLQIGDIYMPTATGAFAPNSKGGQYNLINENFGDVGKVVITGPGIGKTPVFPGVPSSGTISTGGNVTMAASLTPVADGGRFLSGVSLPISGSVRNTSAAASSKLNWQITSKTTGVTISPTSASNVSGGQSSPLSGSINSSSLPLGTQTASITVHGNGTPANITAPLTIDPVTSRTIDSVTSSLANEFGFINFNRAMINQTYSADATFNSAAPRNTTTDLTLNSGSFPANTPNGTAQLDNSTATKLNGTTTQAAATFSLTPTVTGPITTYANFGTTPFTGETLAAGTPTLPPASVPYQVIALEPRTLDTTSGGASAPISLPNPEGTGGYLYGAVVSVPNGLQVISTDATPGPNNATWVFVATAGTDGEASFSTSDGTTNVGTVYSTKTVINGANSNATKSVPISIGLTSFGTINGSANLGVATAEAAYVNDTTSYSPVNIQYQADNVGLAATGGTNPFDARVQDFGAPLIAVIPAGGALAPTPGGTSLTSFVTGSGTAGSASTVANSPAVSPIDNTNFHSTLGTGADILQSGVLPSGGTVSMAWRNRNENENGNFANDGVTSLPAGVQWLVSDVVKVQGVPSGTAYAMQMSYNPDINTLNEPTGPAANIQSTYILELEGNQWVRASDQVIPTANDSPFTGVADSLADFLTTQEATINPATGVPYTLDDLVGSWGVDLANNESWVVLNQGDVTLAVAPEPGTFVLLIAGGGSLLAWRWSRRRAAAKAS